MNIEETEQRLIWPGPECDTSTLSLILPCCFDSSSRKTESIGHSVIVRPLVFPFLKSLNPKAKNRINYHTLIALSWPRLGCVIEEPESPNLLQLLTDVITPCRSRAS